MSKEALSFQQPASSGRLSFCPECSKAHHSHLQHRQGLGYSSIMSKDICMCLYANKIQFYQRLLLSMCFPFLPNSFFLKVCTSIIQGYLLTSLSSFISDYSFFHISFSLKSFFNFHLILMTWRSFLPLLFASFSYPALGSICLLSFNSPYSILKQAQTLQSSCKHLPILISCSRAFPTHPPHTEFQSLGFNSLPVIPPRHPSSTSKLSVLKTHPNPYLLTA